MNEYKVERNTRCPYCGHLAVIGFQVDNRLTSSYTHVQCLVCTERYVAQLCLSSYTVIYSPAGRHSDVLDRIKREEREGMV